MEFQPTITAAFSQMLEASNRLTQLDTRAKPPLAEITTIAQEQFGLSTVIVLFDQTGELHARAFDPNFSATWTKLLNQSVFTRSHLDQLIEQATSISQSYYFVPDQAPAQLDWLYYNGTAPTKPLLFIALKAFDQNMIGQLIVIHDDYPCSLEMTQQLEVFANQASCVIETAYLRTRQTRQVESREALIEAGQRIAIALNRQETTNTILEASLKILPQADSAFIYYNAALSATLNIIGLDRAGAMIEHLPKGVEEQLLITSLAERQTIYKSHYAYEDGRSKIEGSLLIEPLLLSGLTFGTLMIVSAQSKAFSEDDLRILKMLANQAAIAIQNARLYAEARRVDELEALYETGQAINQTLDLQETLSTILTISCSLTGASIGKIYLYRPEENLIDSAATIKSELVLTEKDHRRSSEIAWQVLKSQKPSLLIESLEQTVEDSHPRQIDSWLTVPIGTENLQVGVLELGSDQIDTFTADDVRLLQVIASQAATAIENARLYEKVQRGLQQTKALSIISQSIIKTLELDHVLELVVQSAVITIPAASYSTLYLYDEAHETFVPKAKATNQNQPLPTELEEVTAEAILEAIHKKATLRLNWQNSSYGLWSMLIAPLQAGDAIIGAIAVESPQTNTFLQGDETLLNTFANHASIAIQNANLFRDLSLAYFDLTEKQEEILQNHRTLQALFDSITDGLYLVDPQMKLIAINQAEAVRLGKPPETLLSKTCDETIWAEAAECITKIVHQTFRTGEEKNWESQINIAHRGPFTDRDVRTYPIFEPPDRVVQVIIFAQDVSEKRQLQASLFRSANLAAVGQLASGIAHQINNPLTVIIANSQIMQMDTDTRSPDYPVIQHIVDAGTQIRAIVQNLLDFSSQDSYDWGETDLLETIEDALSLVGQSLARKEISIIKHFTPIPSIIGSTSRLKLLWMSLLLNAEDAITETKHPGTIEIWVEALDTKFIQIKIVDNGIGIPSSLHDRLFHPFFSTKSTPEHVGLGLYTCRAIISAHQGQIRIDANQDLPGTTVTVNLPA